MVLPQYLAVGAYSAKEVKAPEGHVLLEKPVTFTIKAGETQEVVIPNAPVRGRIRIVKKADAGGEFDGEAITGEDSWMTVAYDGEEREAIPRTGR